MKVLTCSRHFPKGHPKAGQPTWFVEKIWKSIWDSSKGANNPLHPYWEQYDEAFPFEGDINENIHRHQPKHTTIRAGSRFKPGEMVSLRVWSDKPYRSKQIEFAQVEVRKTWPIEIVIDDDVVYMQIGGVILDTATEVLLAKNDGLRHSDFISWFAIHPKKKQQVFRGQIISWSDAIDYTGKPKSIKEKI